VGNETETMTDNADRWEHGCQRDDVRNRFVIPRAAEIFNQFRPHSILDVGSGTGYTARLIDNILKYRPTWSLIDCDADRSRIAAANKPEAMDAGFICSDFIGTDFGNQKFDCPVFWVYHT
jgi:SAM-dependent methyltransferase